MAGFLQEKAAETFKQVLEEQGIEPGELLNRIEATLEVINELAPVAEDMAETADEIDGNVKELQTQIEGFNENSNDMVTAINELGETMEKFNELFEETLEEEE